MRFFTLKTILATVFVVGIGTPALGGYHVGFMPGKMKLADIADVGAASLLCSVAAPEFQCCEDATAASCNDQPWESCDPANGPGDCTDENPPYDTCTPTNTTWFGTAGFAGEPGRYASCDTDFVTTSEAATPRSLVFRHVVPFQTVAAAEAKCRYHWTTSDNTTPNTRVDFRAIAYVTEAADMHPSLTAADEREDSVDVGNTSVWDYFISPYTDPFCIQDADTGICCVSNECDNKFVKFEAEVRDTGTDVVSPFLIAFIDCEYTTE